MNKNQFNDQVVAGQIIKLILWSTPRKVKRINLLLIASFVYILLIVFSYPTNIFLSFPVNKIIFFALPVVFLIVVDKIMKFKVSNKRVQYLIETYMREIHHIGVEKFRLNLEKNPKIAADIRMGLYEVEKRANPFTIIIYKIESPSFKMIKRENLTENFMKESTFVGKIKKDKNKVKIATSYNRFKRR